MNNEVYMNFIEERFYVLKHRVELRSTLNILNLHIRSEDFYRELFNLIYDFIKRKIFRLYFIFYFYR